MTDIIAKNKEKQQYISFENNIVYIESDIQGIAVYRRTFSNVKDAIKSVFVDNKEDITDFSCLVDHPDFEQYKIDYIGDNCMHDDHFDDMMDDEDVAERAFELWIDSMAGGSND